MNTVTLIREFGRAVLIMTSVAVSGSLAATFMIDQLGIDYFAAAILGIPAAIVGGLLGDRLGVIVLGCDEPLFK